MHWPLVRKTFNLSRLAEISGVDKGTIQRWQIRGCMPVVAVGRGTDRAYHLSDALHVAIIAEMGVLGLKITGKGADLSAAIVWHAEYRLKDNPSIAALGSLALVPLPAEGDWLMDHDLSRAIAGGSCTIVALAQIAEGVFRRYAVS
jgi:hypothetical protein